MEQLADNGSYAYVDDLDEARKLFVEDLTSTLQVIALDAKIQVDFNPDVVIYYRLIRSGRWDSKNNTLFLEPRCCKP
jgi:Ca-activated chloride channel homolog